MEVMRHIIESRIWLDPLAALVGAFVFGQMIAWTYEFTFHGVSYSRGFSHAIVLVCVSASILVLAMEHSLLAGIGLFGILSMIRFRTDLRTPRDLVFVMGAACVGVASGVGAIIVATLGAASFSAVALYLHAGPFGARVRYDGVLRFTVPAAPAIEPQLRKLLDRHCRRQTLLHVEEAHQGSDREHVYQVKFFREPDREALLAALRDDVGASNLQLMLQDIAAEY